MRVRSTLRASNTGHKRGRSRTTLDGGRLARRFFGGWRGAAAFRSRRQKLRCPSSPLPSPPPMPRHSSSRTGSPQMRTTFRCAPAPTREMRNARFGSTRSWMPGNSADGQLADGSEQRFLPPCVYPPLSRSQSQTSTVTASGGRPRTGRPAPSARPWRSPLPKTRIS